MKTVKITIELEFNDDRVTHVGVDLDGKINGFLSEPEKDDKYHMFFPTDDDEVVIEPRVKDWHKTLTKI